MMYDDVKAINGLDVVLVVNSGFFRSFTGYASVFELDIAIAAD